MPLRHYAPPFDRARRAVRTLGGHGLVALALGAGCAARAPAAEPAGEPMLVRSEGHIEVPAGSPLRARLRVDPVRAVPVRRSLESPAEITADPARLARIAPPLAGRVVQLFVHFGDRVSAGQPLFALDSAELVAAQTDYLRARSALAQAERTVARQRDLAEHGVGSQREVEQAELDRDLARSELGRSQQRLRLLGIDPGSLGRALVVRAPIAGRVVEFSVAPGEYRNDASQSVMTIADLSSVWVTAHVQEKDMGRVRVNEDATVSFAAYPGEQRTGRVAYVGDLLDHDTRTIAVRVVLENADGRLRPGMFATVRFTETAAPELVVASTGVLLLGDVNFVFVEAREGSFHFERRRVTVGGSAGEGTVITEGLRAGERVVVRDAVLLQ